MVKKKNGKNYKQTTQITTLFAGCLGYLWIKKRKKKNAKLDKEYITVHDGYLAISVNIKSIIRIKENRED